MQPILGAHRYCALGDHMNVYRYFVLWIGLALPAVVMAAPPIEYHGQLTNRGEAVDGAVRAVHRGGLAVTHGARPAHGVGGSSRAGWWLCPDKAKGPPRLCRGAERCIGRVMSGALALSLLALSLLSLGRG